MIRPREVPLRTAAEERRRAQRPPRPHYNHPSSLVSASASSFFAPPPSSPLITLDEVGALLRAYGVALPPRNLELYRRALTHVSASPGGDELRSNERLEYAGDGVIESIFKTHVVRRFPHLREDRLSYLKVALVSNLTIGGAARKMGLAQWYQVAPEKWSAVMNDDKAMGDIFEAFVGAIYADYDDARVALREVVGGVGGDGEQQMGEWCVYWPASLSSLSSSLESSSSNTPIHRMGRGPGYMIAQDFVERVYELHVDWTTLLATETNYKGVLQERLQRYLKQAPVYVPHHLSSNTLSMTVWWNWGVQPSSTASRNSVVVSLLEDMRSLDEICTMKASEPYVHMLLLELPPMQGTIKEVEQFAAEKIWRSLPPVHPPSSSAARHAGGPPSLKVRRPAPTADVVRPVVVSRYNAGDNTGDNNNDRGATTNYHLRRGEETERTANVYKRKNARSPSPPPLPPSPPSSPPPVAPVAPAASTVVEESEAAAAAAALRFRASSFRGRVGRSASMPPPVTVARYMGPATVGNGYTDGRAAKKKHRA